MDPIEALLTEIALDPFAALSFAETPDHRPAQPQNLAEALRTALAANEHAAIAGPDWQACETCSDPGTDEHDPFQG